MIFIADLLQIVGIILTFVGILGGMGVLERVEPLFSYVVGWVRPQRLSGEWENQNPYENIAKQLVEGVGPDIDYSRRNALEGKQTHFYGGHHHFFQVAVSCERGRWYTVHAWFGSEGIQSKRFWRKSKAQRYASQQLRELITRAEHLCVAYKSLSRVVDRANDHDQTLGIVRRVP